MEQIQVAIGQEQTINVGDYNLKFTFDPFNQEWHYDLMNLDGEVLLYNVVLKVNGYPLKGIADRFNYPKICLIDNEPNSKEELVPYTDFGDRLGLYEIVEG